MPDAQAARIRCGWKEFRNGCAEIRGDVVGGGGVKTVDARDVAIRKPFSAGARIAKLARELQKMMRTTCSLRCQT
jgi:hypothetical protein